MAISTAAGRAAVAILRISGPAAGDVLLALTPGLDGQLPAPRVQTLATISHPQSGEVLDQVLLTWFPAPGSYTGEDVVEVATHGGYLTPQLVLDATLAAGARLALPGEFTHRAHINGKLDLLQAEAVLDLIDGRSRALHRAAIHQLDRGLSYRIDRLRDAVLQVEALSIYSIDFPEEDEPPVPPERIRSAAVEARERIDALLQTAQQGELLREGALVVLAGEPNSGKSSLFNALLGVDRAIVTEVPGTTRDAIEAFVELKGFPFRLVDTAGLRSTTDQVEAIGIEVARRYLAAADLVLFCVPASRELNSVELDFLNTLPADRVIVVATMSDVGAVATTSVAIRPAVAVSALQGSGLGELGELLVERAYHQIRHGAGDASIITRERHARALQQARDEVEAFIAAMDAETPLEIAATHLRSAAGALEEIVGVLSSDDVLGRLFGEFCVGK